MFPEIVFDLDLTDRPKKLGTEAPQATENLLEIFEGGLPGNPDTSPMTTDLSKIIEKWESYFPRSNHQNTYDAGGNEDPLGYLFPQGEEVVTAPPVSPKDPENVFDQTQRDENKKVDFSKIYPNTEDFMVNEDLEKALSQPVAIVVTAPPVSPTDPNQERGGDGPEIGANNKNGEDVNYNLIFLDDSDFTSDEALQRAGIETPTIVLQENGEEELFLGQKTFFGDKYSINNADYYSSKYTDTGNPMRVNKGTDEKTPPYAYGINPVVKGIGDGSGVKLNRRLSPNLMSVAEIFLRPFTPPSELDDSH